MLTTYVDNAVIKNTEHKFTQTIVSSGLKKRRNGGSSSFGFAYNIWIPAEIQHEYRGDMLINMIEILDVDLPKFMNGIEKSM